MSHDAEERIVAVLEIFHAKDAEIALLKSQVSRQGELEAEIGRLREELAARDQAIAAKDKVITAREKTVATRDNEIATLRGQVADQKQIKAEIARLKSQVSSKQDRVGELEGQIENLKLSMVRDMQQNALALRAKDEELNALRTQLVEKEAIIADLHTEISRMREDAPPTRNTNTSASERRRARIQHLEETVAAQPQGRHILRPGAPEPREQHPQAV